MSIAPTLEGFAYSTCDSVVLLDGNYEVVARRSHEVHTPWSHATRLAAHDDTVYGVTADSGKPVGEFEESPPTRYTVFALALDGTDRFRQDLGAGWPGDLITGRDGYYLDDEKTLRAFDLSGAMRWMSSSRGKFAKVASDGEGGLVIAGYPDGPLGSKVAFERVDSDGVLLWTKTWVVSGAPNETSMGVGPIAGSNGGLVVTGGFRGTLDLGDRVVPGAEAGRSFVAQLGPDGSTTWLVDFPSADVENFQRYAITVLDDHRVVLIGSYTDAVPGNFVGLPKPSDKDGYAIVFDGSGALLRTIVLGGKDAQTAHQVIPLVDGTVAIELLATPDTQVERGKHLQIGSATFSGYEDYIFTLAP